jgi:hypothetical protein
MPLGFSSQEMTVHKFRVCWIISETVGMPKTPFIIYVFLYLYNFPFETIYVLINI